MKVIDAGNWDRIEAVVEQLPLTLKPARLPDPNLIPPREWLYGTRLIRRYITVLVAPGGTGKTLYSMAVALALASGKPLLGDPVHVRVKVWVFNLEDPMEEMERRVAAMMLRHGLTRADLEGYLFLHSGRDRRLAMANLTDDGHTIVHPDKNAVVHLMRENDIGAIFADPFVKSHSLDENSNPHMDSAATAWSEVCQATGAAGMLVHHTRKGLVTDIEASRGAKALTDAARVGITMSSMASEEADQLGISEEDRWRFVRVDDAKANMAPKALKAHWFEMEMQPLGNTEVNEIYPKGDNVAAIVRWEAPSPWEGLSMPKAIEVLESIQDGPGNGEQFTAALSSRDRTRWAGSLLVSIAGRSEGQAKSILREWVANGVLIERSYRSPSQRKDRTGIGVDALKLSELRQSAPIHAEATD